MKIKVGDIVKFLNDVGGGKVTKILDKETALVLNETGFEIPVLIDELMPEIKQVQYETTIPENNNKPEKNIFEEEPIFTDSSDVNFYLAYVPVDQKAVSDCNSDIYLINDSNLFAFYNFSVKQIDTYSCITGKIEPNVKEKISMSEITNLPDNIELIIQILYFKKENYEPRDPVNKSLKINSAKFFKESSFKENDFFNERAMIIKVTEDNELTRSVLELNEKEITEIKRKKGDNKESKVKEIKNKQDKYLKEVDLHLHEIIDDETGLSDHDKIQYQMDVFHKEMDDAVKQNYKRIVFIHGVGTGSLKLKIRNELQNKYRKYKFQDASFKEYGYGATMVLLRR